MSFAVPGFDIVEPIGSGGFSRVYRAKQIDLDRDVALKVLTIDTETAAQRTAFERECRAMGALAHHPSIVSVFTAVFADDGRPCIAMEYFGNGTLGDRLQRDGSIDIAAVLRIGIELAGALQTAHHHGVVHRDIKPSNLFVSDFGAAVLGDFGISSFADERSVTGGGGLTVHYASPELIEGEPASAASDVYSLAAALYTMAAGDKPFPKGPGQTTADLARRILIEPAPLLVAIGAPASLALLLRSSMAKDPGQRPVSAGAFGRRLQEIQGELGLPVTSIIASGFDDPVVDAEHRGNAAGSQAERRATTGGSMSGNRRLTAAALGGLAIMALGSTAVAVRGSGVDGEVERSTASPPSTAVPLDQFFAVPPVPTAVAVETDDAGRVVVSWLSDPSGASIGYQVERVGSAEVVETSETHAVFEALDGTTDCVVVRAVGDGGRLSEDADPVCLGQR